MTFKRRYTTIMQSSLFILGRQPALGIAELESLFGPELITPIDTHAAIVAVDPDDIPFNRIGGSIKLAGVLTEIQSTDWTALAKYIEDTLPKHLSGIPEGKLKLGFSTFGIHVDANTINKSALQIKKAVKSAGRSVRIIPNNDVALNSAQVIHNQLTSPLGMELIFLRNGSSTLIAQTISEQDIESYAARDQQRPMRDARVGMLPPKLAQIIVNLATGAKAPDRDFTVLDPFCGTGVVLQEAGLMGFSPLGSDLEPRMTEYSKKNLEWLQEKWDTSFDITLITGDATNLEWQENIDAIACETYLGRPFSSLPDTETLTEVMQDVNLIHKRFLQNVARQTKPGLTLCLAVPAWKTPDGFKHLKLLDSLEVLGYTRRSFVHARESDLIYYREGQVVARELVSLIRK